MVKLKWIKKWKERKIGDISNVAEKSAENFVSQGYAEYYEEQKLSEKQINEEIEKISKLKLPGEVNKKIKEIKDNSNYSLSDLQKRLKDIKEVKDVKEVEESNVTDVTSVTSVTSVTDVTPVKYSCVTRVTCNKDFFPLIFGNSALDKIMGILVCEERRFTYGEIAKKLGKEEASIRMTISRNKHYFDIKKGNDKICYTCLLHVAIEEINQKIKNYYANIEKNKEIEEKKDLQENQKNKKKNDILLESKNFYNLYKKDIKRNINIFFVDFNDLEECSILLSDELITNPEETLSMIEQSFEELGIVKEVRVRIENLPDSSNILIEDIRSRHINSFITIKAKIIQSSESRPHVVNSKFECPSCGTIISVLQLEKRFNEPKRCSCGRRGGFKLLSKDLVDTARFIIQDLQENSESSCPRRLNCFVKEDLASREILNRMLNAGNDILVNGILKEIPVPLKTGGLSTRFELALEVNNVKLAEEEIDLDKIDQEEIEKFELLAQRIDEKGIEEITPSFAPVVIGNEYAKQTLVLYPCNQMNRPGIDDERNKSNTLLIGDPSTAKSVLAKFLHEISIGSIKTVGGSASAVGITGSAQKDEFLGGWMINPGALVLAKDLLFLEELNTMSDEEKSKIIDAMESQYVDITKAGTSATFKVRTGIVSCANPSEGHFKSTTSKEDIVKQFNIPSPMLARFDTVFLFRDVRDKDKDFKISLNMKKRKNKNLDVEFNKEFLKKFFYYTRMRKEPKMSYDFQILSAKIYSIMRDISNKEANLGHRVSEAIDRMCIASAKLRGSEEVEEKDLERVVNIFSNSYFATPDYNTIKLNIKNQIK